MKVDIKEHHEFANQNYECPGVGCKGMDGMEWEPKWEFLVSKCPDLADMKDDRCRKYAATRAKVDDDTRELYLLDRELEGPIPKLVSL